MSIEASIWVGIREEDEPHYVTEVHNKLPAHWRDDDGLPEYPDLAIEIDEVSKKETGLKIKGMGGTNQDGDYGDIGIGVCIWFCSCSKPVDLSKVTRKANAVKKKLQAVFDGFGITAKIGVFVSAYIG